MDRGSGTDLASRRRPISKRESAVVGYVERAAPCGRDLRADGPLVKALIGNTEIKRAQERGETPSGSTPR